jgi:hypothetical protein
LSDVWVGKADGSDAKQVTSGEAVGFGLTWIADRLAAGTPRGKWFVMNSDGSNKTSLTGDNDPHLQVSTCNDDKHIVYWNVHNGQIELWSAAADGANAQKLVPATMIGSGIVGRIRSRSCMSKMARSGVSRSKAVLPSKPTFLSHKSDFLLTDSSFTRSRRS